MDSFLQPQDIAKSISSLVSKNSLWENKIVNIFVIANKKAGCFTQKNKSKKYKKILSKAINLAEKRQTCTKQINSKVFCTEYANHAKELADSIITQIIANPQEEETNLLVVAGGDGTSYEVQTALFQAAQQSEKKHKTVTQDICLLRLPLGTGNDGTDGRTLEETINLLLGEIKFEKNPALKISYQGNPTQKDVENTGRKVINLQSSINTAPWFSFNVFSMGIDAYVCYMTNVLKSKMPGNFYHFFIPICAILYDKVFPAGTAKVEYYDENNTLIEEISTPIELFVMGISGQRTYGGGHKILATKENTIIVPKLSTLKLLLNFKKIKDGTAYLTNLVKIQNATKVKIFYDKPVLIQCDGEPLLLCKEHFPITIEKSEPIIQKISPVFRNGAV